MAGGRIRIGISGWRYAPWRGKFYPKGWAQRRELEYASRKLATIEINGSFYSLQSPASYRRWREGTPENFLFAVKGGRFITHMRRLRDVRAPLANFFASGVLELGPKLGPVLWQLPPSLKFDVERIREFLRILPMNTAEASALARKHDQRLRHRASLQYDKKRPLRHAFEVRHPSFEDARFIELLRGYNAAMVVADTAGKWPVIEDVTADFIYIRLHGDKELYASGYTPKALERWAKKIRSWSAGRNPRDTRTFGPAAKSRRSGRDVYVYFDNDVKVHAPFDAIELARQLDVSYEPSAEK